MLEGSVTCISLMNIDMNTDTDPIRNCPNVLNIAVINHVDDDTGDNLQYLPPLVVYNAGPPPSIQLNRRISIGMMNREQVDQEIAWMEELVSDLENLNLSDAHIQCVLYAMEQDLLLSHPGFFPQAE